MIDMDKRKGERTMGNKKGFSFKLDIATGKKLKIMAIERGVTLSDMANQAIVAFLASGGDDSMDNKTEEKGGEDHGTENN
jgi:hypothetical protein